MARRSNNIALNQIMSNQNSGLLPNIMTKSVTFAAGTTGAIGTFTLATVTGAVAMSVIGVCTTDVTGSGSIEVGTGNLTGAFIATTTGTGVLNKKIWWNATPAFVLATSSITKQLMANDTVVYKITTNTLTAGVVKFYIMWAPMSDDAAVV